MAALPNPEDTPRFMFRVPVERVMKPSTLFYDSQTLNIPLLFILNMSAHTDNVSESHSARCHLPGLRWQMCRDVTSAHLGKVTEPAKV